MAKKRINEDPFAVANELVAETVDVNYLRTVAIGITINPVYERLVKAVEPRIDELNQLDESIHHQIAGKDTEPLFNQFSDTWCAKGGAWASAAFTAGIALGIRMAGGKPPRKGRRSHG
jgi:hypothetical protein